MCAMEPAKYSWCCCACVVHALGTVTTRHGVHIARGEYLCMARPCFLPCVMSVVARCRKYAGVHCVQRAQGVNQSCAITYVFTDGGSAKCQPGV